MFFFLNKEAKYFCYNAHIHVALPPYLRKLVNFNILQRVGSDETFFLSIRWPCSSEKYES